MISKILYGLLVVSLSVSASPGDKSNEHRQYGKGYPFAITDLPARSKLRNRLESLPPQAKQKALDNLNEFTFPESDVNTINVDDSGDIFYEEVDSPIPGSTTDISAITLPPIDVFKLHSKPDSVNRVYLDFNGHVVTKTAWNSTTATFNAVPFDLDGIPSSFNTDERARVFEIWHRVAEDYAPFNIDVTTEEPATLTPTTGRIVITKNLDASGIKMPSSTAGGVAYTGVFGRANYATYYSPAFIYYNSLGNGFVPYVAEAVSHEFGHNLGLSHDGVLDGTQNTKCAGTTGYYCGIGNGFISWGSIMGVGYYTNVTEWSNGEYPSANNKQDDIAVITSKLGLITDNDDGSFMKAKPLYITNSGVVTSTTPDIDPSNALNVNKGVIETRNDTDVFYMDVSAGPLTLNVKPAWVAFYRTSNRGANLDIEIRLYDSIGNVVVSNDLSGDTNASISATVPAGRYYLTINGVGNTTTPYSDYSSLGQYYISGNVTK